jgi:KaiC/GvpD/RAD55 family RecA-like ATPase
VNDVTGTGIDALDTFLKGGLPRGFTTILLAPAGAGSEIFAKQFAAGAKGGRVVYVTTDESEAEVRQAAKEARWGFDHVEVVDLQSAFADAMMAAQEAARGDKPMAAPKRSFDPRELLEGSGGLDFLAGSGAKADAKAGAGRDYLASLVEPYARIRTPDRMVVHSLDFFLNHYPIETVVSALTALKAANSKGGGQVLLVLSKGAHGVTVERRLELLADCLLELEVSRKGTTFERFFMVKKVKNRAYGIGVSTYDIAPDGFRLETLERIV